MYLYSVDSYMQSEDLYSELEKLRHSEFMRSRDIVHGYIVVV